VGYLILALIIPLVSFAIANSIKSSVPGKHNRLAFFGVFLLPLSYILLSCGFYEQISAGG